MTDDNKKILIIGLDGGTFDLVHPWTEAGYLPNLKRLMEEGVSRTLDSTFPPVTSPAWPSFMTGMNSGKHGVFDFIRPEGTSYKMVNATSIKQPTLWDRLALAGKRTGVINVPVTYPPRQLPGGWMITGLLSPHTGTISAPADLIKRYEPELGHYRIAPDMQYASGLEEAYAAELIDVIETRGRYGVALLTNEPWDVSMIVFGSTDIGSHALWRFMDETHPQHNPDSPEHVKNALRRVYQAIDVEIGRLLDAVPDDTTILVMSDHGFGPLDYTVNLNLLLMEAGLMHLKNAPMTRLKAWLFRRGITPKTIYRMLEKVNLHHLAARVSKERRNAVVSQFLSYNDVDWERTEAFSMGHVGQIYINNKDVHPQGSVEPGHEVWEAQQAVLDALDTLRHPLTGEKIVDRIILREQEFTGPYADKAPDIQLIIDGYRCISFPLFATTPELFTEQIRGDSGSHRREGMFIAYGPGIRQGVSEEPAHITDVAPTVMYLLGMAVPEEMDGKPLQDILTDPHEVRYSSSDEDGALRIDPEMGLSEEETEQVKDRLRALGYLE